MSLDSELSSIKGKSDTLSVEEQGSDLNENVKRFSDYIQKVRFKAIGLGLISV